MMNLQTVSIVAAALALLFKNHIRHALNSAVDNVTGLTCHELKLIRERCPRARYNIEADLAVALGDEACTIVKEGVAGLEYDLPYGNYWVDFEYDYLYMIHTADSLTVRLVRSPTSLLKKIVNFCANWTLGWWFANSKNSLQLCDVPQATVQSLKDHIEHIHQNGTSRRIVWFFTATGDKWACPCARSARVFNRFTAEMQKFFDDVEQFVKREEIYKTQNLPFRRGYMLHGLPGTNKSLCTEILATKYNMPVHMLNVGDKNMTDSTLINLVNRVPPRSIITIEEVDKQFLALTKAGNSFVTMGGILTALDGPQRLNHGCIVILTSNARNFLPAAEDSALFRQGRIDKIYHFETSFEPNIDLL